MAAPRNLTPRWRVGITFAVVALIGLSTLAVARVRSDRVEAETVAFDAGGAATQATPAPETPQPSQPGQPTEAPVETPPQRPDVDVPSPSTPGTDPSPTPISPVG